MKQNKKRSVSATVLALSLVASSVFAEVNNSNIDRERRVQPSQRKAMQPISTKEKASPPPSSEPPPASSMVPANYQFTFGSREGEANIYWIRTSHEEAESLASGTNVPNPQIFLTSSFEAMDNFVVSFYPARSTSTPASTDVTSHYYVSLLLVTTDPGIALRVTDPSFLHSRIHSIPLHTRDANHVDFMITSEQINQMISEMSTLPDGTRVPAPGSRIRVNGLLTAINLANPTENYTFRFMPDITTNGTTRRLSPLMTPWIWPRDFEGL